jgi:hypothetical protein
MDVLAGSYVADVDVPQLARVGAELARCGRVIADHLPDGVKLPLLNLRLREAGMCVTPDGPYLDLQPAPDVPDLPRNLDVHEPHHP